MPNLLDIYHEVDALKAALGLMNWDRQVLMPAGGGTARGAHVAILAQMAHERFTSDEMGDAIADAERDALPGSIEAALARCVRRDYDLETKLPTELVARRAKLSSEAYDVWKVARANSDFAAMAPYYEQLFDLNREKAGLLGYQAHIYDPLIDTFEESATFATAQQMFATIKKPIQELVGRIAAEGRTIDDQALIGNWDRSKLLAFMRETTAHIGFSFERGRLDEAPNAFCGGSTSQDVRMTTRASNHLKGIVSSSLHEMGHGLYDQGSPTEFDRTPLAGGTSLAIHESQSRLWENIIGRSLPFWSYFLPRLQAAFPDLSEIPLADFYRMINKVEPTAIRVGADELTYNLHILIRFEMEVDILNGTLQIKDMPEAWNSKYQEYLGFTPKNDGEGVLQDVHWSRGMVGYFPTYAMGNLIGGQIWKRLTSEIEDYAGQFEDGNFSSVLGWLQQQIYQKARTLPPKDLLHEVVGEDMKSDDWLSYATAKYTDIYFE